MAITMNSISRHIFPKVATLLPSLSGIGEGTASDTLTAAGQDLFLRLIWTAAGYSAIRLGKPCVILHMVHHRLHIQTTVLQSSMFTSMHVRKYQAGSGLISMIQAGLQ
jgi:hypothetical protein